MKIANRNVESVPYSIINVTVKGQSVMWFKSFWTASAGVYGHQAVSQQDVLGEYSERVTGGCGFDKQVDAFEAFIKAVMGKYCGLGMDCKELLRGTEYNCQGNYRTIPLKQLKRIVNQKLRESDERQSKANALASNLKRREA